MPKLPDIHISARHEENSRVQHDATYPCSVDTNGTFTAKIPPELASTFERICRETRAEHGCRVVEKKRRGGGVEPVVSGSSLAGVRAVLHAFGMTMVRADVTTELRIFYTLKLGVQYYKTAAGEILANGQGVRNYDKDSGKWHGDRGAHFDSDGGAVVGLGAAIVLVKTVTPPNGEPAISYERPDDDQLGEYGLALRKWNGQPWPRNYRGEAAKMRSIPYDEHAAKMFDDALHGLAKIADLLETNLADADALPALLAAGAPLLLGNR